MSSYPALEMPSATVHGSESSTRTFYKIEVRTTYHTPKILGEGKNAFVIDHVWREIPIYEGHMPWASNVPVRHYDRDALDRGLVSRLVAEAHRWTFLAALEAGQLGGNLCIETRIVQIELSTTIKTREVGVSAATSWSDIREQWTPRPVESDVKTGDA